MRLSNLFIRNFRGIPTELSLDLKSESTGQPSSAILFGDNGTGKSSITDALEFALQGRLNGSNKLSLFSNSAISLTGQGLPTVRVLLSDGTEISRSIVHEQNSKTKDELVLDDVKPHRMYSVAPFVLRRADILRFIDTPDAQRQLMFFSYFRSSVSGNWVETPSEIEEKLQAERTGKKEERRILLENFALKFGVSDPIPANGPVFEQIMRDVIYGGLTNNQRYGLYINDVKTKVNRQAKNMAKKIRQTSADIGKLNQEIANLNINKPSPSQSFRSLLSEVFDSVGLRLTSAFKEISTTNFVDHIELVQGDLTEVALSLKVHLKNRKVRPPKDVFSEANLDLLSLLVFLSIAQEAAERGQERILILDDVFQSVDSTIRFSVVDYILREFKDWQLIFTVHDRLWQSQLREICRKHNHPMVEKEIIRWSFDEGPVIRNAQTNIDEPLLARIHQGDVSGICSSAGLLLEEICHRLSWTLPISVTRRKEDKYTLGDLWPGVLKTLKKTEAKACVDEVDKWMYLRNLVGAHYNEWAQSLSTHEAISFGEAVVLLLSEVKCAKCHRWIESSGAPQNNYWSCRCGQVKLNRS